MACILFSNDAGADNLQSSESDVPLDDEEEYEQRPRNLNSKKKVRHLLPAKGKNGLIFRSEVAEEDDDQHEVVSPNLFDTGECDDKNHEQFAPQNVVQLYAKEHKHLEELKTKVGLLASHIVEDPENNMRGLKELILMLQSRNTKMIVTEMKLLALSLLHVFLDVLPEYRIRGTVETDKKTKLKKETKKLLDYETSLLRNYKKYVDCLNIRLSYLKKKAKQAVSPAERKANEEIGLVAVKCLCNLLVSKMNFNYFKNIANILVPLAAHRNDAISNSCCLAIEKLYKSDRLGEASMEVVKMTCKLIKERKFSVPGNLMLTFLHLKVQEADLKDSNNSNKKDMKQLRKRLNMMSNKERKRNKKMRDLENQLREAEAQESVEKKKTFQTEILQKVFWVYFHVIKDSQKFSLLTPVLEGLSKFAHLINLEYFNDLNIVLCGIMEQEALNDCDKFHCMQTMFTVLLGHAEYLSVDPQKMYCHAYNVLLNLHLGSLENYVLMSNCLDLMIIKRKRKISANRILAFIKRLCTVALQAPLPGVLICLSMVRKIMMASTCDILLDTEDTIGSGIFSPELEDPEHCNVQSSALWELQLLRLYSNPVNIFADHILHGCPVQGGYAIPSDLSNMSAEEMIKTFGKGDLCGKRKRKGNNSGGPSAKRSRPSFIENMNNNVAWSDVKKHNFDNKV